MLQGFFLRICRVDAAIEQVGAQVRFLPPYSPDFNSIELAFAKLKSVPPRDASPHFEQVCDLIAAALGLFNRIVASTAESILVVISESSERAPFPRKDRVLTLAPRHDH